MVFWLLYLGADPFLKDSSGTEHDESLASYVPRKLAMEMK